MHAPMKLNRCCAFNAHNLFDFCSTGVANELVANVTKNLKAFYVNDKELKPFQLLLFWEQLSMSSR